MPTQDAQVEKGDYVVVKLQNFVIRGVVSSVYHDPLTKQYGLEINGRNGVYYWKQWIDGGEITDLKKA